MLEVNKLYNIDCIKGMSQLDDESINLCITSPPYNLWNETKHKKIEYNTYKDNIDFLSYISWLKTVFYNLYYKLTEDGRVIINIGDKKNGLVPSHFYVTKAMLEIGYRYYTTIIWNKSQISRRTSWGSFNSPSCPSFPTPFEYILVFYKKSRKLIHSGESDLTKEEFIKWSLAIWSFAPETRMKQFEHPAMFPEELPRRCIKMFSYLDDVVVDPFSGIGTTCKVAKDLNREYIGFEIDEKYHNKALERIK